MIFDVDNETDLKLLASMATSCTVGLTSGCFDLFHYRHLVYLQKCRRLCDFLVVGVNSDRSTTEIKGPNRPIIPEHERLAVVAGLQAVNAVFVMDDLTDFGKVGNLLAQRIFRNEEIEGKVYGTDKGAEVIIVPDTSVLDSTTAIIAEIVNRKSA